MATIKKINNQYVITELPFSNTAMQWLNYNEPLEVEVYVNNNAEYITENQRRFIFRLCNSICLETGENVETFRYRIMIALHVTSLQASVCSKNQATRIIRELIDIIIIRDIQLGKELKNDKLFDLEMYQVMMLCLKRQCLICGTSHSHIHHVTKVGMGRNRNEISHIGYEVMPLCVTHHNEVHNIGDKAFKEKYHINHYAKVDKHLEGFIKTGNIKFYEGDVEDEE